MLTQRIQQVRLAHGCGQDGVRARKRKVLRIAASLPSKLAIIGDIRPVEVQHDQVRPQRQQLLLEEQVFGQWTGAGDSRIDHFDVQASLLLQFIAQQIRKMFLVGSFRLPESFRRPG